MPLCISCDKYFFDFESEPGSICEGCFSWLEEEGLLEEEKIYCRGLGCYQKIEKWKEYCSFCYQKITKRKEYYLANQKQENLKSLVLQRTSLSNPQEVIRLRSY